MKNRLPVYLDGLELPKDNDKVIKDNDSYGYVSILYILSMIITGVSVLVILGLGNR